MNELLKKKYHAYVSMYGDKLTKNRRLYSQTPIVLDIGTKYTKVGLAGDSEPSHIFLSCVGDLGGKNVVG